MTKSIFTCLLIVGCLCISAGIYASPPERSLSKGSITQAPPVYEAGELTVPFHAIATETAPRLNHSLTQTLPLTHSFYLSLESGEYPLVNRAMTARDFLIRYHLLHLYPSHYFW